MIDKVTEYANQGATCAVCGKPAACIGSHEGREWAYACNECCRHGYEDGTCVPCNSDEVLGVMNALRRRLEASEAEADRERDAAAKLREELQKAMPAPPRGRVVSRWKRVNNALQLEAGAFSVIVYDRADDRQDVVSARLFCGIIGVLSFAVARAGMRDSCARYIRHLVSPFGGELVVEEHEQEQEQLFDDASAQAGR